jgi:hypothetical protein
VNRDSCVGHPSLQESADAAPAGSTASSPALQSTEGLLGHRTRHTRTSRGTGTQPQPYLTATNLLVASHQNKWYKPFTKVRIHDVLQGFFFPVRDTNLWARRTLTTGWDLGRGQGCHVTMDRRSKMLGNAVAACLGLDSGHPSVSLPTGASESVISYQSMCLSLTHCLTTTTTTTTACVGLGRRSSHFVY